MLKVINHLQMVTPRITQTGENSYFLRDATNTSALWMFWEPTNEAELTNIAGLIYDHREEVGSE